MWKSEDVFSSSNRRTILKVSALGVIVYSIAVLVYSNLVPNLGVQVIGLEVGRVDRDPVLGTRPTPKDIVTSIAGDPIDSWPKYVNTVANLRDSVRFPSAPLGSIDDLAALQDSDKHVAQLGEARFVRVRFLSRPSGDESVPSEARSYESWFEVGNLPWQKSAVSVVWFGMESLIFWMGWLVFRRRPEDDSAALFFLMCIVTVGAYMGGYHWLQIASNPALTFMFAICAMAVPQINLHFYLLFPTPKGFLLRWPRWTLLALYVAPAILQIAILWMIGRVISTFRHELPPESVASNLANLGRLVWVYLAVGGTMFAGCVASLLHSYRSVRQGIQGKQVQLILAAAVLASFFVAYSFWLAIFHEVDFALGDATWAMFAASLVFTCAYAVSIARYRLLYVEEILQRGMVYLLISFTGGVCYWGLLLLMIWFAPWLATDTSHNQAWLISTFVIVILLTLTAIRSRIQKVLDRRFFREKHQLDRAMRQMDEAVGNLVERHTVLRRVLLIASDILDTREAAIYLRSADGFVLEHQLSPREFPQRFAGDHELVRSLAEGRLLQANLGPVLPGDITTSLLRRLLVEIAQPFVMNGSLIGFVLVGPKEDGMYGSDELEFLSGFAELTTLVVHSAESQGTLERLNEELREKVARISQQQRQLLAIQSRKAAATEIEAGDDAATPAPFNSGAALDVSLIRGSGAAVEQMIATVRKVASSQATVLVRGESGTGKGLLAEVIHRSSPRASGPFVKVHCAALSSGLLESELFGHVKGSFTGAHRDKIGRFQAAHRGTLFLDEIGDINLDIQTKLLRVLQEKTFEPVGSTESVSVDVRIIAATHQPLEELIKRGRLREDLFFRLNVISIRTPPLRERREDILELALHFLNKYSAQAGKNLEGIEDDVVDALTGYDWPGNIRELENAMERAVVMTNGPLVTLTDLPAEILRGAPELAIASGTNNQWLPDLLPRIERVGRLPVEMEEIERQRLLDALEAGGGNKAKAASLLGIPRSTFCSKLKKFGIA